ncbi:MAG: flagellar biosynthesis protein FlhB [Rhodothermales bacterium]
MAEKDERTEDPTSKRKATARSEGQVFKSQEVLSVGMLLIGMNVLAMGTGWGFERMKVIMGDLLLASSRTNLNNASVQSLLHDLIIEVTGVVMPFLLILMISGVVLNLVQSGWNFTGKPLAPKFKKINPINGAKRIFSASGLFNFLKSFLKIAIVGPIAYFHIAGLMPQIVLLHAQPLPLILSTATGWFMSLSFKMIAMLGFLSALDFVYERHKFKENLKMSKQEVKDERKQSEGDPKVKKQRFKLAMKLLRRPRLDHAVSKADVVITNPTHYAVALRYDPGVAPAPQVLVKGIRKRALRIRELAIENGIPVIEEPPLARALYRSVPEEQIIPEELYPAVATILASIYRKRKKTIPRVG